MKKTLAIVTMAVACLVGINAVPASAAPIVVVTVDPNPVVGPSGGFVDVFGTITNTDSIDSVDTIEISFTSGFAVSFLQSIDTLIAVLGPNDVFTGVLGTLEFPVAPTGATELVTLNVSYWRSVGGIAAQERTSTDFDATVPEPVTMSLFGVALAGAAIARRRRA